MAQIKKLKDNNSNTIYPMTQASAVFLNNGERLSDDYFLIKGIDPDIQYVSDLYNTTVYFKEDEAIKDPTLYFIRINVNGQQQLAYSENPLNSCLASDFDENTGIYNAPLFASSFTDGKIYTTTKDFYFIYNKSNNSATLEAGQNDLIKSLEWTVMA